MAPHPHEEGGEGAGDQQAVQIEALGGGTAAVGDGKGEGERTELWRGHGTIKKNIRSTSYDPAWDQAQGQPRKLPGAAPDRMWRAATLRIAERRAEKQGLGRERRIREGWMGAEAEKSRAK
jgi:hypothetical protein